MVLRSKNIQQIGKLWLALF